MPYRISIYVRADYAGTLKEQFYTAYLSKVRIPYSGHSVNNDPDEDAYTHNGAVDNRGRQGIAIALGKTT